MGQLINLAERRAQRTSRAPTWPSAFYFDLSCPFSYLAGERVERLLGRAEWHPAPRRPRPEPHRLTRTMVSRAERSEAERAAEILRLPLSWPENYGGDCTGLHRAAAFAREYGAGPAFALAALRLGFSGGFDLADPLTLSEAAAAARVPVVTCVEASRDARWDSVLEATDLRLASAGIRRRPAFQVGGRWCQGPSAVLEAAALRRAPTAIDTRPAG